MNMMYTLYKCLTTCAKEMNINYVCKINFYQNYKTRNDTLSITTINNTTWHTNTNTNVSKFTKES